MPTSSPTYMYEVTSRDLKKGMRELRNQIAEAQAKLSIINAMMQKLDIDLYNFNRILNNKIKEK